MQEEIIQSAAGAYIINGLTGIYKVAMSKPQALLTGTLGSDICELTLSVDGMGKKLTMQLSSVKKLRTNKEDETSPNDEESVFSSAGQNQ